MQKQKSSYSRQALRIFPHGCASKSKRIINNSEMTVTCIYLQIIVVMFSRYLILISFDAYDVQSFSVVTCMPERLSSIIRKATSACFRIIFR